MTFGAHKFAVAGAALLLVAAGTASAQVPWSNPSGVGSFFSWSGGQSGNGLFGSPVLQNGNIFAFSPANFVASSQNGQSSSPSDQVQVHLTAFPGQRFTQIRVTDLGNWQIGAIGSVQANGTLFLTDLVTPRPPALQALNTNPLFPQSTPNTGGDWSGQAFIDLTSIIGPNWTDLQLIFTNTLQANSGQGSSATIRKTGIRIEILPTPGSAAVLGLAGVVAARRRRR
jgi:hypothetical protein